ncbi:MAG: hypothetical protein AB8B69_13820 [Chitinophagales bacterium]
MIETDFLSVKISLIIQIRVPSLNLQSLGKMIGIISYVEALKERIGTQVQVKRLSGGYSTLKVVPELELTAH